jgi:signal peptidase
MRVSINDLMDLIREKLEENGEVQLTVSGNSMLPFFHDRRTEVTLAKPQRSLRRGDIILFSYQNNWVLHRILRIRKDLIITAGDALTTVESIAPGVVLAIVTKFRNDDRETDVRKFSYRLRVGIWMFFRPLRRILMRFYHRIKKREQ